MPREPMSDIIVLLPGIMGSVLTRDDKVVWGLSAGLMGSALFSLGGSIRKDLTLHNDSPDPNVLADDIVPTKLAPDIHLLPGVWKIDGYSKIADHIKKTFDVTEGVNFFQFPYDWRRDNRVSAKILARKTHEWLTTYRASKSPKAKLILVAHSMGGLVSRYFIEVLDGWKDTRALITFGTPYRGSLNAVDGLSNGVKKGPMGLFDLTEMARSLTGLYQLLPVYPCYDNGTGTLARVGEISGIPNIDAARAKDALKFHDEIRDAVDVHLNQPAYLANRYRVHPIVGMQQETNQSAVLRGGKVDMLKSLAGKDLSGDGTVPRVSATPLEYSDASNEMYAATQHGSLQNADAILVQLAGLITGLTIDLGSFRGESEKTIGVEVEDMFFHDEPVTIRAHLFGGKTDALTATITGKGDGASRTVQLHESGDGWYAGTQAPLAEGGYQVRIDGPNAQPAADVFVVARRPVT